MDADCFIKLIEQYRAGRLPCAMLRTGWISH